MGRGHTGEPNDQVPCLSASHAPAILFIVSTSDQVCRQEIRRRITIAGVKPSKKSENELIAWIRSQSSAGGPDLPIGIGDDMAMIRGGEEGILVTSDMLMDGVDFDAAVHAPDRIGRKALAVSLSDCAAMAVRPRWAMVSVALPNAWTMMQAQKLFEGVDRLARQYEVALIGGDTNSWDRLLVIDVTVIAEPWGAQGSAGSLRIEPVRRSGMLPGDLLVVSGKLGGSILGHHLDFTPRVLEAKRLAEKLGPSLHAMVDLSDGFSMDAHRLADASGCGIVCLPQIVESLASEAAIELANKDGRTVLDHVLNDGEDFELLCAVDAAAWSALSESEFHAEAGTIAGFRMIGSAEFGSGVCFLNADGSRTPIEPRGWQHFTDHA